MSQPLGEQKNEAVEVGTTLKQSKSLLNLTLFHINRERQDFQCYVALKLCTYQK